MREKVSKTESCLVILTAVFLCVLLALFQHDRSRGGESGTYTVTTERTAQGEVAPEPLLLDLNSATAEELTQLSGVGEVIAQRIVDWREENGPFRSIEEIMEVKGIGQAAFEEIRDSITVTAGADGEKQPEEE